jgi:hypothetical protein
MAVQFHNAPDVSPIDRAQTVSAGGTGQDRESPAEFYHRQKPRMATDTLAFGGAVTKSLSSKVKPAPQRPRGEGWTPSPVVVAILAVAVSLVMVYWAGGLELAMILSLTLLGGLLLYGLGADRVVEGWTKGKGNTRPASGTRPLRASALRVTGPLV